jgi:branched-chain amino acid transport system substrate-binding protein
MKKLCYVVLAIAMFSMSLVGCAPAAATTAAPAATSAPAATTAPVAKETIKIGYIGALSGETAVWGQAGLNGLMLTAKEINANGGILGRQVEIIGLDGRGQAQDSVNALNKLIDENKVLAVIGTNFSSCNIPMAPIADAKHIPLIATAASNPKVTVDEKGVLHPYSFRIGFIDPFQGEVLASYAFTQMKAKNAAIITNIADDYSVGLSKFFESKFTTLGGKVVIKVEAQSGDNDYRAQLSKVAELKPDVIMVPWIYKDVALIANQARELGITAPMIGGDGWDSKELLTMAGTSLEGGFYTSQPSFANPATKPFADAYLKEFDNLTPETEALFGHDGLYWIKDALERAGKVDAAALRDALETTVGFKGLMGEMTIDPKTHNPAKPASIYTIKNGKFEYVGDFK